MRDWLRNPRRWGRLRPGSPLWGTATLLRVDARGLYHFLRSLPRDLLEERASRHHRSLVRRYVGRGGRYLHLLGVVQYWPRPRQALFQYRLSWSARRAPTEDLLQLLDVGGWREHLAVSWLVAVGRRADLRDRIEHDLLGDTPCGYGWDYCIALARLGTERDADLLCRYLDRALLLPAPRAGEDEWDDAQCQIEAMGALLHLDETLGTARAQPYLAPGGLWERWCADPPVSPQEAREQVGRLVAFAAGRNPGFRRQLRAEH